MANENMKAVYGITKRGRGRQEKSFWTRIGVAYVNRDGSLNVRLEYLPADLANTDIHIRDFPQRDEVEGHGVEPAPGEAADQPF